MQDHDAWSVVKTKPTKQPAATPVPAAYVGSTTMQSAGMVTIALDEKTNPTAKPVQIPIGSDLGIEGGMKPTLEKFRQTLGVRAPACSKSNVYWILVWHELAPSESESLVGVLRFASEQELDTLFK
jgi:hypothetical protein